MDIIIYNADIQTMDVDTPKARAIGIKDGLVSRIGTDADVLATKTAKTRLINAGGRCVIPGLNDSHMHLLGYAANKNIVDLTPARSVDDIIKLIKKYITEKNIPANSIVTGRGWNQNLFADAKPPTRRDLDIASDKHCIIATRVCGHALTANSLMLKKAGVTGNSAVSGGEVLLYDDGTPNGILTETAMGLVSVDDAISVEGIKELLKSVAPELAAVGITSVQTDDFSSRFRPEDVIKAYSDMADDGTLKFRVTQQCRVSSFEIYEKCIDSRLFKLGPVKFFSDGSLGARTAYMQEDYHDMPGVKGVAIHDTDALNKLVENIHINGRDVAIHAIGDGAIRDCLNAIERVQKKMPRADARHGIVHAQITTAELLERFKTLGVIAFIQPIFIDADAPIAISRVGVEKAATSYAFKTLLEKGVQIPMGTDCPVEPFDPFNNIYCAVTRKCLRGGEPFNSNEALTVEEAVKAYTVHSAYASHEEHIKGKLIPGYFADLAVLSKNIFNVPHEEIIGTKSLITIMDGRVVNDDLF